MVAITCGTLLLLQVVPKGITVCHRSVGIRMRDGVTMLPIRLGWYGYKLACICSIF